VKIYITKNNNNNNKKKKEEIHYVNILLAPKKRCLNMLLLEGIENRKY